MRKQQWAMTNPVHLSTVVRADHREMLRELAAKRGLSLAAYVRRILRRHLKEKQAAIPTLGQLTPRGGMIDDD